MLEEEKVTRSVGVQEASRVEGRVLFQNSDGPHNGHHIVAEKKKRH